MDLEDLKFFKDGRKITEVYDEFGLVYGARLLEELSEQGLIEEHQQNKGIYILTGAGEKKLKVDDNIPLPERVDKRGVLKVFLSYSSLDYDLAKKLKDFLEQFGMNIFLAHTSIEAARRWEDDIYLNLKTCDVFIPILTNNFKNSRWTDQECGIAYNEEKKIIPLMIDLVPYGFLGKFQALRVDTSKWVWRDNDDRVKIVDLINQNFPLIMRKLVIDSIEKTSSWIIGKTRTGILKQSGPLSDEELNKILEAGAYNSQFYDADGASEYLKELLDRYKDSASPEFKDIILGRINRKRAIEILGGDSEAGFPTLYGTPEQRLKQLNGYGGKRIEEMREKLKKEVEDSKIE